MWIECKHMKGHRIVLNMDHARMAYPVAFDGDPKQTGSRIDFDDKPDTDVTKCYVLVLDSLESIAEKIQGTMP